MRLREFFTPESVRLDLSGATRGDILNELVDLLKLDERSAATLVKILSRREELGSTGVGRGIAIPHGRSLVVNNVRLAYGHHPAGIAYDAIDGLPVHHFFLIVAPPIEVSNQYLPILGKIAQFAKEPDVPVKLARIGTPQEFLELLEDKNI